jgi:uncharacterized protein (DUF1919 family)
MLNFKDNVKLILLGLSRKHLQNRVQNKKISIFSNDCWAGELYQHLQIPYLTPFVGLVLKAPCYIKLLERPRYYLEMPLKFVTISHYAEYTGDYPLARIDDIEIHFMHYKTPQEALDKWTRRLKRINWDNIYVKFDVGKDHATPEQAEYFLQLPFARKLVLAPQHFIPGKNRHIVTSSNYLGDATHMFYESIKLFDIIKWLNSGEISKFKKIGKLKGIILSRGLWMMKLMGYRV